MVFYILAMSHVHVIKKLQLKAGTDKRQVVFSKNSLLIIHNRIHNEEKPDKFKDCGKDFSQRRTRECPQRIHTGEKPCKCMSMARSLLKKETIYVIIK